MKNEKIRFTIVIVVVIIIVSSCSFNSISDELNNQSDVFSFSFVYSDESDEASSFYGDLDASEGNIYKVIYLDVTNLSNEVQSIGKYFTSFKLILSNNHQYNNVSFFDSIMPGVTKRLAISFEILEDENINNSKLIITHSVPTLYEQSYELNFNSNVESERSDYELKSDIIGTWRYVDPETQEDNGYISFTDNFRCLIANDAGWTWTGYSIENGILTITNNDLNNFDYSFKMFLAVQQEELVAFSDENKIQAGSGKLHTYQKLSSEPMDSYSYSMNLAQSTFLIDRYWFTEDLKLGFYFESDGTGKLFVKSDSSNTYSKGNITWCTEHQNIAISLVGYSTPIYNDCYAFVSDYPKLYLYINGYHSYIFDFSTSYNYNNL